MPVILSRKGGGSAGGGGVTSIKETGQPALTGAVTLSEGDGITLTQAGQDISIASAVPSFYKSGMYIEHPEQFGFSAGVTTQDSLLAVPVFIWGGEPVVFQSISIEVTTLAAASTIRIGFYGQATDGGPGPLLYDLGTVSAATTGIKTIASSFTLGPGLVWMAQVAQGGTPSVRSLITNSGAAVIGLLGLYQVSVSGLGASPTNGVNLAASAAASGALPDPFAAYAVSGLVMARYELRVT